jgi:hypothetical protein
MCTGAGTGGEFLTGKFFQYAAIGSIDHFGIKVEKPPGLFVVVIEVRRQV